MSFRHILVGTDFAEPSVHAVKVAEGMAKRCGARLTIAHAYDPTPLTSLVMSPSSLAANADLGKMLEHEARASLSALTETFTSDVSVTPVVVARASPAAALCALAHEKEADLLVVGSYGRTGLERFFIGSVAEKVVRHARCATLVVRAQADPATFPRRIHACTDFSEHAAAGLALAREVALTFESGVRLIHSRDKLGTPRDATIERQTNAAKSRELEALYAAHFDGPPNVTLVTGETAAVGITEHAHTASPDALVLATHGRGAVQQLLIGSTAERVTRHAPCSVFVARPRNRDT